MLFPFGVNAQSGLKGRLDKTIDQKIAQSRKDDSLRAAQQHLLDTLAFLDTVKVQDTTHTKKITEEEPVILFDTSAFEARNLSVKERKPKENFTSEEAWQRAFLITNNNAYKEELQLDSSYRVFGWHPYWMGNAYQSYNFSLLSVIAYFSYELNPYTGSYKSIHDWKSSAIVDSAHKHGCKVVLSVTNFGKAENATFLSNVNAQKTFINTLITLLREKNADGVNIDFEAIPVSSRNALTNFIIDLSSSLRTAGKGYLITIALPAVDFEHVYEIKQLVKYVDLFVVMGYDFYGSNSSLAGPVAPLASGTTWWPFNLERSIDEYLVSGILPKKLLLGLPYYGAEWQTSDLKFPSKAERFIGYSMYRNIIKEHGLQGCCLDDVSGSKYYVYRDNQNHYRQIWYEDKTSLGIKYDWVKEKKIGGIGIWALGYDNGYTELWKLLADKFAVKNQIKLASTSKSRFSWRRMLSYGLRIARNPKSILSRPRPLMMLFGGIFGVSLTGFFLFWRYGHRFKKVYKVLFKGGISLLLLLLVGIIFLVMKYAGGREVLFLFSGFLVAGVLFFIFSRKFLVEKDLP